MVGFETYFRAATKAATLPLVFVRTRAEADYEITGITKQVPSDEAENVADFRTTRQETAVRVTKIDSGEEVFRHLVPNLSPLAQRGGQAIHRTTRSQTPNRLLAIGKETAAQRCVQALQGALVGN